MVRVQCPHCQRCYRTEIEAFGRTAVCTKCSQSFKIGTSRPPFQWQNTELAEDSWIGVAPPEEKQEMKHCIMCDAPLRPAMLRCPECGANQVTGVVQKKRATRPAEEASIWDSIPVRPIVTLLVVALLAGGGYWFFKSLTRKTAEVGDELADNALSAIVARQIREGTDERELSAKHAGRVKDANLAHFMSGLTAENVHTRRSAILLIAAGDVKRLDPLVAAARDKEDRLSDSAKATLAAIRPRRMVHLSCDADEAVRKAAAEALCVLFDLDAKNAKVAKLAQAMSEDEKTSLLNDACRSWPYLVGGFVIRVGDQTSDLKVFVEQVGKVFYLRVGSDELQTSPTARQFDIPIHRWCVATGVAVDAKSVQDLLTGRVVLGAPSGAEWVGTIEITARRRINGELPGFLPINTPEPGKATYADIRLDRPVR